MMSVLASLGMIWLCWHGDPTGYWPVPVVVPTGNGTALFLVASLWMI